jgi:ADP-heptose:LPS heptosyltransferase
MTTIVLLRPDKAGDLIKSIPVLRALNKLEPKFVLHLIVSKANESLLKYENYLTYSVLPSGWEQYDDSKLQDVLTTLLPHSSFEVAVNLLSDAFPSMEKLLNCVSAQEKFSIFSESLPMGIWPISYKNKSPIHRNETLNIAEIVGQALGLDLFKTTLESPRAPLLGPDDEEEALNFLKTKSGAWIGACPFAGTLQRTHPLAHWEPLIKQLCRRTDFDKVILFGAPTDLSQMEILKQHLDSPSKLVLCSPSSFRSLGAYLKRCDRVISVDSGPLHFSLALGIPSLGFLSGGDHLRWFSQISPRDKLVKRGIFNRYPSSFEMKWHFSRWK